MGGIGEGFQGPRQRRTPTETFPDYPPQGTKHRVQVGEMGKITRQQNELTSTNLLALRTDDDDLFYFPLGLICS